MISGYSGQYPALIFISEFCKRWKEVIRDIQDVNLPYYCLLDICKGGKSIVLMDMTSEYSV